MMLVRPNCRTERPPQLLNMLKALCLRSMMLVHPDYFAKHSSQLLNIPKGSPLAVQDACASRLLSETVFQVLQTPIHAHGKQKSEKVIHRALGNDG